MTKLMQGDCLETNKLFVYLYNCGYSAGHHDTIEGCFTDILPVDSDSYHDDVVTEILDELVSEDK